MGASSGSNGSLHEGWSSALNLCRRLLVTCRLVERLSIRRLLQLVSSLLIVVYQHNITCKGGGLHSKIVEEQSNAFPKGPFGGLAWTHLIRLTHVSSLHESDTVHYHAASYCRAYTLSCVNPDSKFPTKEDHWDCAWPHYASQIDASITKGSQKLLGDFHASKELTVVSSPYVNSRFLQLFA